MKMFDPTEVYARYKAYIATRYAELRQETARIIEREQLVSVMNDTKWLQLQIAVLSIPDFRPAYRAEYLLDETRQSPVFETAPTYEGCWDFIYEDDEFGFPPFFSIRWVSIHPRLAIHRGRLIEPEIIDRCDLMTDILRQNRIPYTTVDEHTFLIEGYR